MHESVARELIQELRAHTQTMNLHTRAIACHCECLGMNAENCQRASLGQRIAYSDDSYLACLLKYGLVTEDYKSNI